MATNCSDLITKVRLYDNSDTAALLEKACQFSINAHRNQKRDSGEPYFHHPLAVANILAEMKLDSASIITALLHDTVEDTETTIDQIHREFSEEIATLVDGVTKLRRIEYQSESKRNAENFRKLLMAMSNDIRVLLIKLADRLHNMRTLKDIRNKDRRLKIAIETMDIYAPLAERIGMQNMKNELQDAAFKEIHPDVKLSISNRLELLRNEDSAIIEDIEEILSSLMKSAGIKCRIVGREKTPYSIWRKMKRKNIRFEQLTDVMAFRVIAADIQECYKILGIIHQNYHAVPESFYDFISTPKKNGYQSIHTVVIGPKEHKIEIQIRTEQMHHLAELGVAAHWCYKQDYEFSQDGKKYNWIRELLNILETSNDFNEFLVKTKLESYDDSVFCFTPKGQVIALPKNSTVVDFAYAVHSDIGNHCVGAKINARPAPLSSKLQNGDQVQIITNPNHVPLPSWESFVVTQKALSEIKRHSRLCKKLEYINLGRVILAQAFAQNNKELNEKNLKPALTFFNKKHIDELFQFVGEGLISAENVMKQLLPSRKAYNILKKKLSFLPFVKTKNVAEHDKISIKGLTPGMAVHFAECCHPIPGDNILGVVVSGKGVAVHISDCKVLQESSSSDWMSLSWGRDSSKKTYIATIQAVLTHQLGSLATLAGEIAKLDVNISNFKISSRSSDFFDIAVDLEVRGVSHLSNIMAALRTKPCIHSITRTIRD